MSDPAPRVELWVKIAWVVFVASIVWALYLGSRLAGRGPIAAWTGGPVVLSAAALLTGCVGLFWSATHRPFATAPRLRALALVALVVGGVNVPFPFPSRHDGHPSAVHFELPVEGTWTVVWGGPNPADNLPARVRADRRYGLVLAVAEGGSTSTGDGARLADYRAFGQPMRAPADGVVERALDGCEDRLPGAPRGDDPAEGNHVVLRVAPGEYLFLTHLQRGSVAVSAGQDVRRGDLLGAVGASGWSPFWPEPHLALHLQDGPDPFWGQPIPWRLHELRIDGAPSGPGMPAGGVGPGGVLRGSRVERNGARAAPGMADPAPGEQADG